MATIKQKMAFKKVVKGSSLSKAMREVGFSKETAKRTNKLTASKGWAELIDKYISEEALMKVHKAGLTATQMRFTPEGEQIEVDDFATRHKYLETGYKVRGKLKNEEPKNVTNILNVYSEEQLRRIAARVHNGESASETASNRLPNSNESAI